MKIIFSLLVAIITLSCSPDNSINDANQKIVKNTSSNNVEIDSSFIKFYDAEGKLNTVMQVSGTYHAEFDINSGYAMKLNAANLYLKATASDIFIDSETGDIFLNTPVGFTFINGAEVDSKGGIKANDYKSSAGNSGKTYTEEFEDKQGNIRTRVYENGLLVSYKINGVEQ